MPSRQQRLRKLVEVQQQLKTFHEMRHANFVADARAAGEEAAEIMARADAPDSLSALFPEVYARGVERAVERQKAGEGKAAAEAGRIATETVRTDMVERAWREARQLEERGQSDRDRLEAIERGLK